MIHLGSGLFIQLLEDAAGALLKLAHPEDHTQNVQAQTSVTQELVASTVGPVEAMLQFALGDFQFVKNQLTGKWDLFKLGTGVKTWLATVEQATIVALFNTLSPNQPAGDPPADGGSGELTHPSSYSDLEKRNIEAAAAAPKKEGGFLGGLFRGRKAEETDQATPAAEVPAAPAQDQAAAPQAEAQQAPTGDGGSAAAGN